MTEANAALTQKFAKITEIIAKSNQLELGQVLRIHDPYRETVLVHHDQLVDMELLETPHGLHGQKFALNRLGVANHVLGYRFVQTFLIL